MKTLSLERVKTKIFIQTVSNLKKLQQPRCCICIIIFLLRPHDGNFERVR